MKYTIVSFSFENKFVLIKQIMYMLVFLIVSYILVFNFFSNVVKESNVSTLVSKGLQEKFKNKETYVIKVAKNHPLLMQSAIKANNNKSEVAEEIKKVENVDKTLEDSQFIAVMRNAKKEDVNYSEKNSELYQSVLIRGIKILNYSSNRTIDYYSLFKKEIMFEKSKDAVLLYNTHTSETYANSEKYKFGYTGTCRTTDARYNMLNIATHIKRELESRKIKVVQDTTPHDYGSYNNAYKLSRATLQNNLKSHGSFGICMDVHRDAVADLNKAFTAEVNGKKAAQLMFVIGLGTEGYPNKYGVDNLALAMQIVEVANKKYPGLFRNILVRNSKYNQDLNNKSLLLECGGTGNTIEEVEYSTELFANVLNCFYK